MSKIPLDYTKTLGFLNEQEITDLQNEINEAHDKLHNKIGVGNDLLGWLNLPCEYSLEDIQKINVAADKIKKNSDVLIVIGIGGSYLGSKAAIEMLTSTFYNILPKEERKTPQIFFAGNSTSSTYLCELYNIVKDKDISVNVISKSGTTTEPALAFRVFKDLLEKKYGKDGAKDRIYVTTDEKECALMTMATKEGYEKFIIPASIGGRYSVLTAVGLLPIAVSGINIQKILDGAKDAYNDFLTKDILDNDCYKYAAVRNALYRKGKTIEIIASYEPSLVCFSEWWKQLFGESEGKGKKGIFPASATFSTDLHSIGQYIQDGIRNLFETVINVLEPKCDMVIKSDDENLDGLNYLADKTVDYVNHKAFLGTVLAHNDGGVPNIIINVPKISEYYFGYLVYFFEKACAISGYLLGVNPFDQPGVEEYKKNMFALLGKPGYENEKEILKKRL